MFLNEPNLDISFRVIFNGKSYMLNANTGSMKCFECGDIVHKRFAWVENYEDMGPNNAPTAPTAPVGVTTPDPGQSEVRVTGVSDSEVVRSVGNIDESVLDSVTAGVVLEGEVCEAQVCVMEDGGTDRGDHCYWGG